ncbi:uncharacterized protein LOC130621494 [Hydractinia symbiolongicarpus]|uniref:uncharacterized protein LOC130621494 n=1 Tax=Hydractinia symbiolongicarpus TaxID=13093 RepID=UPI00254BC9C2|nr:uncharacterized protein LOC130621494 [Hydractinia symbiolongicarpus]XP_057292771.1 uncharacterized protein LOC130621494 [Hydractinia symbiolongicarpus]
MTHQNSSNSANLHQENNKTEEKDNIMKWRKTNLKNLLSRLSSKDINLIETTIIMISLLGSFIMVLPYTVIQLGLPSWLLLLAVIILLLAYTNHLMNQSCLRMLEEYKDEKLVRAPQVKVAKLAGGNVLAYAVAITINITCVSIAVAQILVSSTILSEIVPISGVSVDNRVRIWAIVLLVCISPLVYIGFYKDLKQSALLSALFVVLGLLLSLGITGYLVLKGNHSVVAKSTLYRYEHESFFKTFGTMFYTIGGIVLVTPEVIVFVTKPTKMVYCVLSAYGVIAFVYTGYCIIMYSAFSMQLQPSMTATLLKAILLNGNSTMAVICIHILQLSLCLHLMLSTVLYLNPFFTNVEANLNIPIEMNWKRFAFRTCGLLTIAAVCLLIPKFQSVLSLVGGIPLVMSVVIFPIVIYAKLYELTLNKKVLLVCLWLFTVICMVGNFVINLQDIVTGVPN